MRGSWWNSGAAAVWTRYLVDAGHRVIATDASPAMLDIARTYVPDAHEIRRLVLPDDPILDADAIVAVGHVLSYLPDAAAIERALVASAEALRKGGLLALNICDLAYGAERADLVPRGWVHDDWALVTQTSLPTHDRFVRQMAIFSRNEDGSWRRDDERHDNILVDTSRIPALLAEHGVDAELGGSFGTEEPIAGLITVTGRRLS